MKKMPSDADPKKSDKEELSHEYQFDYGKAKPNRFATQERTRTISHLTAAQRNKIAWEANAYAAWVKAYGTPSEVAKQLVANPQHKVRRLSPYLGTVKGQRIANPLGSHGRLGVALALLGADVTVFDISEPNQTYALELAKAANVDLDYVLGDFLELNLDAYYGSFDSVVLELGIVHYFVELKPFVVRLHALLVDGGRLVLNEFHPLLKKALCVTEGQVELRGDYFLSDLEAAPVAYAAFTSNASALPECLIRRYTLGEIVTAFAQGGFIVEQLVESPDGDFAKLPGTFTLVARRA